MLTLRDGVSIPDGELSFSFSRSSAPGGQNVNKVNSKATLRWSVWHSTSVPVEVRARLRERFPSRMTTDGEVVIQSDAHRDQARNMDDCLEKLRSLLLAVWDAPRPRRKTRPTKGSVQRRLQDKKRTGEKKRQRREKAD